MIFTPSITPHITPPAPPKTAHITTSGITWVMYEVIAFLHASTSLLSREYSFKFALLASPHNFWPDYGPCAEFFRGVFIYSSRYYVLRRGAYIRLHSTMFTSPLKLLQRVSRAAEDVDLSSSTQAVSQSQNRALIPYTNAQKEASLQAELTANRARTAAAAKETQPKRTRRAYDPKQNEWFVRVFSYKSAPPRPLLQLILVAPCSRPGVRGRATTTGQCLRRTRCASFSTRRSSGESLGPAAG